MAKNKHYNSARVINRYRKCVYCNSTDNLTTDHVIPHHRAEEYGLRKRETHAEGNLVAACDRCNFLKGCKTIDSLLDVVPGAYINFINNSKYVSDKVKRAVEEHW